jgi:phage shock protein A
VFKKWWNYIKSWFSKKSDEVMDPEVEIEMAINEARERDQELRNQAAKVIAHRTQVASELEDASADVAEAKELAKQALMKADAATKAGNAGEAEKWNATAQAIAMKMQAGQNSVDTLTAQLKTADVQAEKAKEAVKSNAMQVEELAAKRMELLGELQSAKMQESVNSAMDQLTAAVGDDAPTLEEVENKIQARQAEASAKAELTEATSPEAAMAELKSASLQAQATSALDDLRSELGLGAAPELGGGTEAAAAPDPAPAAEPATTTETPPTTPA